MLHYVWEHISTTKFQSQTSWNINTRGKKKTKSKPIRICSFVNQGTTLKKTKQIFLKIKKLQLKSQIA